ATRVVGAGREAPLGFHELPGACELLPALVIVYAHRKLISGSERRPRSNRETGEGRGQGASRAGAHARWMISYELSVSHKLDETAREALSLTPGALRLVAFWEGGSTTYLLGPGADVRAGRAPECELCLDHVSASRVHARFRGGERPTVEDLGSANGV